MAEASIDQLSIEIEADASKAQSAIKELTSYLNGLSLALNRINTNSINKFARSMESLSTVGRRTDETSRQVEKFANAISSSFGIKSTEGINAVKNAMLELTEAEKKFQANQTDKLADSLDNARHSAAQTIREYAKLPAVLDATTQAVMDYVRATNKGTSKISLSTVAKEFGENFGAMSKSLGKNFTSKLEATQQGVTDFAAYLTDLNEVCKTGFDTENIDRGFAQLVETIQRGQNATLSYNEAVKSGVIGTQDAQRAVDDYHLGIMRLVQAQGELTKENGIDGIVNSLKGLNDIKIPDFAPFAQAIETLNKVSTAKVVGNIKAIKDALNETQVQADVLKDKLSNITFDSQGNSTGFITDMIEPVTRVENVVERISSGFRTVQYEIVVASQNMNIFKEVANSAAKALDAIASKMGAMMGVKQIASTFGSLPPLISTTANSVLLLEDKFSQLPRSLRPFEDAIVSTGNKVQAFTEEKEKAIESLMASFSKLGSTGGGVEKTSKEAKNMSAVFYGAAKAVKVVSGELNKLGDIGVKALKISFSPLINEVEEFKAKVSKVANSFKNMEKKVKASLTNMSKFWQRTMRTFTFMLVRKAITAMIKDIKEAVDELALFEKHLGTLSNGQFNKSLSEILADFHYIGRAIVAAFEPLINFVVPAINAVADALANVLALVGEFFAAFTGQSYFVKARKTVVDYGDSIDDNNKKLKEQKKLLLGIDEINPLPKDKDSSSSGKKSGVNYKDAFEEKPVSDKMKGLVDKLKAILSKLFDPLKDAWDRNKGYVIDGFNYMISEIGRLASIIGKDFLDVWNSETMANVFDNILLTIGHIEFGIGNLAKNFADAWIEGSKGKTILENLAKIAETLTGWIEKTALYFKNWTTGVDFNPLLKSLGDLTKELDKVANFLGGVFYDAMKNVVFKYIEWMIEEGLPHLNKAIGEVIDAFDFEKIRSDLQVLEKSFEHMAEQIHTGVTNAISNVGKALAEWTNSKEFTEFCEALAHFMDLVTAERVEKLFTALGLALLSVAKGLADFVSSEKFQAFIDKLVEWYDSKSAEEIAKYLEDIAKAILIFKFTAFVGGGVAAFLEFIAKLVAFFSIGKIATDLNALAAGTTSVGTAAAGASGGATGFASALSSLAVPIGIAVAVLATLVASFGGISGLITELKTRFDEIKKSISDAVNNAFIPISGAIDIVKTAFSNLVGSLASFKGAWVLVLDVLQKVVTIIGVTLAGALSGLVSAFGGFITFISGAINIIGGVFSFVAGVIQGLIAAVQLFVGVVTGNTAIIDNAMQTIQKSVDAMCQGVKSTLNGIGQVFVGAFTFISGLVAGFVNGVINFFKQLKYELIGDPIVIDMVNGIIGWFQTLFTEGGKWISDLVTDVIGFFTQLAKDVAQSVSTFVTDIVGKYEQFKKDAVQKFDDVKEGIKGKFDEIKTSVEGKIDTFKTAVEKKYGEVKKAAIDKFQELKKDTEEKFKAVKKAVDDCMKDAKKAVTDKAGDMLKNAKQKFGDLKTAAKEKFNDVKGKIREKMDESLEVVGQKLEKIKDKFTRVNLINVGSMVIRGFLSGLKQAWSEVISWASQALASFKSKFTDALKIHSPSRVFMEYGENTVEGFNKGLEAFSDTTSTTVDKWVSSFSDMNVTLEPDFKMNRSNIPLMNNQPFDVESSGITKDDLVAVLNDFTTKLRDANANSGETRVVLELNGRQLYEQVVRQDKQQMLRTGRSLFAY